MENKLTPIGRQYRAIASALVLALLFSSAYLIAEKFRPRNFLADQLPEFSLEKAIPDSFGEWRRDSTGSVVVANPETEALLNQIYSQTFSKTYVNGSGDRVMLSIAYGKDQSDSLKVHFPEICYSAQGFSVAKEPGVNTSFPQGAILPTVRLIAKIGNRIEPISYWVSVGEKVANGRRAQKITQLEYGIKGIIPDGFLVRASTIDADAERSFAVQQKFFTSLYAAVDGGVRSRMFPGT